MGTILQSVKIQTDINNEIDIKEKREAIRPLFSVFFNYL